MDFTGNHNNNNCLKDFCRKKLTSDVADLHVCNVYTKFLCRITLIQSFCMLDQNFHQFVVLLDCIGHTFITSPFKITGLVTACATVYSLLKESECRRLGKNNNYKTN